jgi:hypothetical protein
VKGQRRSRKKGKNQRDERWMTKKMPEYLGRESARERKMIARFRCGNKEREKRYWKEGEERRYRMCYEEKERQLSTCGMDVPK